MKLNEKMALMLAMAEDDRRRESIKRAEKQKPKLIDKLFDQAKQGKNDGVFINDADDIFSQHLADYFKDEGFWVQNFEQDTYRGQYGILISIEPALTEGERKHYDSNGKFVGTSKIESDEKTL